MKIIMIGIWMECVENAGISAMVAMESIAIYVEFYSDTKACKACKWTNIPGM